MVFHYLRNKATVCQLEAPACTPEESEVHTAHTFCEVTYGPWPDG